MSSKAAAKKRNSLIAEAKLEVDREYEATLISCTADIEGEAASSAASGTAVSVLLVLYQDAFTVKHTREWAGDSVAVVRWPYYTLSEICWDHQHTQVRLNKRAEGTAALRGEDAPTTSITLSVASTAELEAELTERVGASCADYSRAAPPTCYIGVFSGAARPKPFQRRRASLTAAATEAEKLTPRAMRRLSLAANFALEKGTRQGLALQHIHTGGNAIAVSYADAGGSPVGVVGTLLIGYDGARVVAGGPADGGAELCAWAHDAVRSWKVVGAGVLAVTLDGGVAHSLGCASPVHAAHAIEFFVNQRLLERGLPAARGTTHGRTVVLVHTLHGETDASDTASARLAASHAARPLPEPKTGSASIAKPPFWDRYVRFFGWLHKKGGRRKKWERRFAVLYQTTQGHFLAYYEKLQDCPPYRGAKAKAGDLTEQAKDGKERKLVDICQVTSIRPAITDDGSSTKAPPFGFEIVALNRDWAFCAESDSEKQAWLQMLSRVVDEDVAVVPDDETVFDVKAVCDPTGRLSDSDYSTQLAVQAQGVRLSIAGSGGKKGRLDSQEVAFWCYTDIQRWSLAIQHQKPCLLLVCFTSARFDETQEFAFRTTQSEDVSATLEFYIEKFMSVMALQSAGSLANEWSVAAALGAGAAGTVGAAAAAVAAAAGGAPVQLRGPVCGGTLTAAEVAALDSDEDSSDGDEGTGAGAADAAPPPAPPAGGADTAADDMSGLLGASGAATFGSLLR